METKFFRNGNGGHVRGGLKQRTKVDPRQIMLAKHVKAGAVLATSVMPRNWLDGYGVGALGNDQFGCCAYAAPAHFINTIRLRDKSGAIIDRADVLREYSKWTGFDPEIDATDQGAYLLDVLKQWASKDGLFGTQIEAFAEVNMMDDDEVAFACSTLGGIIAGFGLPKSAQDENECWAKTEDAPWSWGGHAIYTCDASPGRDAGITWGERKSWTPDWRRRYASEGYAVLLKGMSGRFSSPASGLDYEGLLAAVEEVRRM